MSLINRRNLVVVLVALALTFSGAATLQAQDEVNNSQLISVDFKGGTIAEYIDALEKAAGSVNVLIAPEAADISMPAVKLTKVTVAAAIDLVDGYRKEKETGRIIRLVVDHIQKYEAGEQPTFKIITQLQRNSGLKEETHSKVWSIAYLIKDDVFDSEVILDAVETSIDITKSTVQVEIRFHEATGLLIASGSHKQLNAIQELLGELGQSSQMKSFKEDKKLKRELSSVTQQLHRMLTEAPKIKQKLAQLEAENKDLRAELENRSVRLAETMRMLEERSNKLDIAQQMIRKMNVELWNQGPKQKTDDDKSGNKDN